MSIEDELKNLILAKHKSIREFSLSINMPYSTIDSILKRGVLKASITSLIVICKHLDIDIDKLSEGIIAKKVFINPEMPSTNEMILLSRYKMLDEVDKANVLGYIEAKLDHNKYKKQMSSSSAC